MTPELKQKIRSPCRTLLTHFVGYEGSHCLSLLLVNCTILNKRAFDFTGFSENLQARLIQNYGTSARVANRLARAYGGRAVDVIHIAKEMADEKQAQIEQKASPVAFAEDLEDSQLSLEDFYSESYLGPEALLVPDYPIIEAEVVFGVRHDWVVRPEDFLARRSRLAYLNKEAAMRAIPRVVQLMARELHWDRTRQSAELKCCVEFMRHFGGSKPTVRNSTMRLATRADLLDVFRKAKRPHAPGLTRDTLRLASEMLNHILTDAELEDCLQFAESNVAVSPSPKGAAPAASVVSAAAVPAGVVPFEIFAAWWNSERLNPELMEMKQHKSANMAQMEGSGSMFG